jgi:hypothetical protein
MHSEFFLSSAGTWPDSTRIGSAAKKAIATNDKGYDEVRIAIGPNGKVQRRGIASA